MSFIDKIFGSSSADDSAKQLMAQIEQQMYGSPVGTQMADINGNIYVNTGNGIAQVSIGGVATTATVPDFTTADAEELKRLEADRQSQIKLNKIERFKKLPSALRQQVVDEIIYNRAFTEISNLDVPKEQRQNELEQKSSYSRAFNPWGTFGGGVFGGAGIGHPMIGSPGLGGIGSLQHTLEQMGMATPPYPYRRFPIPHGLSEEDILQAHNGACAEEALLAT